jgi:hypothetical protein
MKNLQKIYPKQAWDYRKEIEQHIKN